MPNVIDSVDLTSQSVVISGYSFLCQLISCLILIQFSQTDISAALSAVRFSPP
jgi:hypothetical protein